MTLTQSKFESLVKRLEVFSAKHPFLYRLQVLLFSLVGYFYILLLGVGLFLMGCALMWYLIVYIQKNNGIGQTELKIMLAGIVFCWIFPLVALKSLFSSPPVPDGIPLKRNETRELYKLVNQLCKQLKAPRFHQILITNNFNASVFQRPRLGFLGFYQNYLILGLPLMQTFSIEQLRAILAHEIGHLSKRDSQFQGRWIYQQREVWRNLIESKSSADANRPSQSFIPFLNWYWTRFSAYSFVLARQNEYAADRAAAKLTSPDCIADALMKMKVMAQHQHHCYQQLIKQADTQAEPPPQALRYWLKDIKSPPTLEKQRQWLESAFAIPTKYTDTHPCLKERVAALGSLSSFRSSFQIAPLTLSAADQLLGTVSNQIISRFNEDWLKAMETPWRERYAYVQHIAELESRQQNASLTVEETWQVARWHLEEGDMALGRSLLEKCLELDPHHSPAHFNLGKLLLDDGNAEGINHLEIAMEQSSQSVIPGCQLLYQFFMAKGEQSTAIQYLKRISVHQYQLDSAEGH